MDSLKFEPKKLLSLLANIQGELDGEINLQYSIQNSTNFNDLSEPLDEFLKVDSNNVNDIAYTATQLAMLHLRREIDWTIELVIESNDLRAYYEFQNEVMKTGIEPKEELDAEVVVNKKPYGKIFLAGFVMISFIILYFKLFL